MDASPGLPQAPLQPLPSTTLWTSEQKSMLIRSLSTILHHTSSGYSFARSMEIDDGEVFDDEEEQTKQLIDGVALMFDSGEVGDAAAVTLQIVSDGVVLDVAKSSNKHISVPQHLTLRTLPPRAQRRAAFFDDWATFCLKWTRFAIDSTMHAHFIHTLIRGVHHKPQSRLLTESFEECLKYYTYYFCHEKLRQRLEAVVSKSQSSSSSRFRFRTLFYDDTSLTENHGVDFDPLISDHDLETGLTLYDDDAIDIDQEIPRHLRGCDEAPVVKLISGLLPNHVVTSFQGRIVLDESTADILLHLLISNLASAQYYFDRLEAMLTMQDLSRDLKRNRDLMMKYLHKLDEALSNLTVLVRASPTCWRVVRCLSPTFDDRIVEANAADFSEAETDSEEGDTGPAHDSGDNVDFGSPEEPAYKRVWSWLESITDLTYTLWHICSRNTAAGFHLKRGLTIRLWIPRLPDPIQQASLEDTMAFVNWDPEEERSYEALRNAAHDHWQKTVGNSAAVDDPRNVFSVAQRILLGLEDQSPWSTAFKGSIHCQSLLGCLMKDGVVRSRVMAMSRRRCACCTLLLCVLEPEIELSCASTHPKSLPWALPFESRVSDEIKDDIARSLSARLKQILWASTTEDRRRAIETSSKVVAAKFVGLRKQQDDE